jgi:hypothetical protein
MKNKIYLKYFCAVTDGCRKGGAWVCMNEIGNTKFFIELYILGFVLIIGSLTILDLMDQ